MKKTKFKAISFMVAVILIFSGICMPALPVMAEMYTEGTITYTYTIDGDNNAIITRYNDTGSTTSLDIPSSLDGHPVIGIDHHAFAWGSSNLTSLTIPASVTSIGISAFIGNDNLTEINVNNTNINYTSVDGVLFTKDKKEIMAYPTGKSDENYEIPASVISIQRSTFYGCTNLKSITIPDSVTSIAESAFLDCIGLTSITIPNSVTSGIERDTFRGCTGLTSITIGEGVTSIDEGAFLNCTKLTSVIIGNSLAAIDNTAFGGCTSLNNVVIYKNPNDTNSNKDIKVNNIDITVNLDTTIADNIEPINNGTATVSDYTSAGISGVTEANINAVNEALSKEKAAEGLELLKSQIQAVVDKITKPATLNLTRNNTVLTAEIKNSYGTAFTTSSAVTYNWYRDNNQISSGNSNSYNLSDADNGTSIKVRVPKYGLVSNSIDIPVVSDPVDPKPPAPNPVDPKVTTPAGVTIEGTERVGKTLEAVLLTESGAKFTTSAGVTYEWYRLSNKNDSSGKLVGDDKTYKLVSSDKGKYIKVIAGYDGDTFEKVTGKIANKSSSSGSSSSSSSSHKKNSTNNSSSTEESKDATIPAKMEDGWQKQSDGTWKYGENGQAVLGWKQVNGLWYLFDLNGSMQTGWVKDTDGSWYYLEPKFGQMLKGWVQDIDGKWYYLKESGAMATEWIKDADGKWYYFYGNGSMAADTTVNGYYLGKSGAWVK